MADGFLSRWSQRKQALREGRDVPEPPIDQRVWVAETETETETGSVPETSRPQAQECAPAPVPTLVDVQALRADSNFAPFLARDVAPEVRNAAMKKLFTDPHYNVMDGLDIYIDDYSRPDPMPAAMLRQMASAKFLKLFDDEEQMPVSESIPPASSAMPAPPAVGMTPPQDPDPHHDHTDLRLQPDHAARPAGPECEPERAADPAFEPVPPPGR
ncbi:DUF3306 domain-containing protein [Rhodoferax sp.]|uniref:DUF3306 domain-containing protein n=1 Tax=Rhodoferax sp. TaxID=50421 RepID=UPI0025EFC052|nr:DUF3306 domain-containing protein [Rhodoferax sp.]MCM2296225.1 DUF3306 domain-containing protein [Rhodoferax sp.]MDD3937078.1 DUF3306 domain-containing protein [Rhodoferax sp.]